MTKAQVRARLEDWPRPVSAVVMRLWWLVRGEWPHWFAVRLQYLRSRAPRTYLDKVRYKMARDRRPLIVTFADKVAVRGYVAPRIPTEYLLPLLAVAERAVDVPWGALPREYVCKVSHGSGGTVVVTDRAEPDARLPVDVDRLGWTRFVVRPEHAPTALMVRLIDHWLGLRYGQGPGGPPEWCYGQVRPLVLVENYAAPAHGRLPRQVNVYCFHGEPRSICVIDQDGDFHAVTVGRFLDGELAAALALAGLPPGDRHALLDHCRALSAETDAVRVDWLVTRQGARFSELTNYPNAGRVVFDGHASLLPEQVARIFSGYWTVPRSYADSPTSVHAP